MEIRDYLRIVKRRLWILVVLPVLAAIIAFFAFSGTPQQYQSKVEASVPTLAANTTAGAVSVYVANFQEFLTTRPVLDRVVKETGVPASDLKSGLTAGQVGTSNLIQVTYTSTKKADVEKVAISATNAALDMTSGPVLGDAQAAVKVAQQRFDQAQTAVQQLVNNSAAGLPEDQYREKLSNLAALKLAAASARLDLDIPKADGLDAQIPQVQQQINDLLPKVLDYQKLSAAQQQASSALSTALVRQQDAQAQLAAHAERTVLKDSAPIKVNQSLKLATSIGIVAGIGLILAGLIIIFLELFNAGRVRRARETAPLVMTASGDGNGKGAGHQPGAAPSHATPTPASEPARAQY